MRPCRSQRLAFLLPTSRHWFSRSAMAAGWSAVPLVPATKRRSGPVITILYITISRRIACRENRPAGLQLHTVDQREAPMVVRCRPREQDETDGPFDVSAISGDILSRLRASSLAKQAPASLQAKLELLAPAPRGRSGHKKPKAGPVRIQGKRSPVSSRSGRSRAPSSAPQTSSSRRSIQPS